MQAIVTTPTSYTRGAYYAGRSVLCATRSRMFEIGLLNLTLKLSFELKRRTLRSLRIFKKNPVCAVVNQLTKDIDSVIKR